MIQIKNSLPFNRCSIKTTNKLFKNHKKIHHHKKLEGMHNKTYFLIKILHERQIENLQIQPVHEQLVFSTLVDSYIFLLSKSHSLLGQN